MLQIRVKSLLAAAGLLSILASPSRAGLPAVRLEQVYTNLRVDRPLWMAEAPDGSGRMFFVEQSGSIGETQKGSDGSKVKEVLRIGGGYLYDEGQNEKGLLGFAFHPKFKDNGKFYVYYTHELTDGTVTTVTSEFTMSSQDPDIADPKSERQLLVIQRPRWNHEGGCLAFGPDGYLYISSGDGGFQRDPFENGQKLSVLLGKMMRIDVDKRSPGLPYGIPSDNPFVGKDGARPEIWAWGLRNPWRYSFDQKTGELYEGDVGEDNWEEVNIITKGGNYGWSIREGFHEFKPMPAGGGNYIDPIMEYAHNSVLAREGKFPDHSNGACITGGYVYRGKKYPALDGIYIYGDYVAGTIWGLRYEDGKIKESGTLLEQPKNFGSFAQDADGEVYALSIYDGRIFAIVPAAPAQAAANH
jgi:quinoprotein glucose dehydrogenase